MYPSTASGRGYPGECRVSMRKSCRGRGHDKRESQLRQLGSFAGEVCSVLINISVIVSCAYWCDPIAMQGNSRCAGGQRLAVPVPAADERHTEAGVLGGKLRTGRVVLQPGPEHQQCHLGWDSNTVLRNWHLLLLLLSSSSSSTAIDLSLGGSSPDTSTDKMNKNKYT